MSKDDFSIAARLKSFIHALRGLSHVFVHEHNAWIHAGATALVIAAAWYFHVTADEWRWLILAIALVWCFEIINTAFEMLCDVVSPEQNSVIGQIKDIAAGAVLVSAIAAAVIGITIFWPYLAN
jgi:diacylglycerol kinase